MKIYSLYILNKAGGLIYQNDISDNLNKLTANDYLVLAGTLHGVHAITSKFTSSMGVQQNPSTANTNAQILNNNKVLNPNTNSSGLQSIETDYFNLYMYQTLTGIKFIIITSPVQTVNLGKGQLFHQLEQVNVIFKELYVLYSDYVMKDPFYSLDMPIKNQLFESKIRELVN